jgi:hypothetical protein
MMDYFETSVLSLISIILILKIIKQVLIVGKVKQERKKSNTKNYEALK